MTTDLDSQLRSALIAAARSTAVADDALAVIVERAGPARPHHHPVGLMAAGGLAAVTALVVAVAVAVSVTGDRRAGPPTAAVIGMPAVTDVGDGCGAVANAAAGEAQANRVAHLPVDLPDGYRLAGEPSVGVQRRLVATVECWSADVTYLDPVTGRLLAVTVNRQGHSLPPGCDLPPGSLPVSCIDVGPVSAYLTDEGTRATIHWVTDSGDFVYVSGFGFPVDELVDAAESVDFDGTDVSVVAPPGMEPVEVSPRTRSDGREITYYGATFTNGDPVEDVGLTISTWDDIAVNEVGPAEIVDVGGMPALLVTAGGPGTGIVGWTYASTGSETSGDVVSFEWPARTYLTWNAGGLTFRVEGSSAEAVVAIAQSLIPRS